VGVGGGVIIIPALVYLLGFTQKEAQGTSLGILLLPVGILAVINYYKQGYIDIKAVIIISLAFVIGGFFGSKLALAISQETLRKVFGTLLLVLAIKILFIDK
jgi:uncharacterized membrane protein YfcA